jgi:hypothetical protein
MTAPTELEKMLQQIAIDDRDTNKSVEDVFREMVTGVEVAEAEFVADFLDKMFAAAFFVRSNSKKAALFNVFQQACENCALLEDDNSPHERLANRVARAETFLFETPDASRFRGVIVRAFTDSKFKDFSRLAEAIRVAETEAEIIALRGRTVPRRRVLFDKEMMRFMKQRLPEKRKR